MHDAYDHFLKVAAERVEESTGRQLARSAILNALVAPRGLVSGSLIATGAGGVIDGLLVRPLVSAAVRLAGHTHLPAHGEKGFPAPL
jgi:hypothetical protein